MELVELNKICDLKNGYAFKSSDYVESSNTLNCRMSNIRPEGYFDVDYAPKYLPDAYTETYKDYLLKDGDLVIAMTDMANDPKILGVPTIVETRGKSMLLNQRVGKLEITAPELIHVPFLQYSLNRKSVRKYYTKFAGGGLQLNVGKKQVLSVKIPLPPLEEQKKIAAILDAADDYRQKTKALIDKYDQLTQSLFLDMFGDPVTNPKGWDTFRLNKVMDLLNGYAFKSGDYVDTSDVLNCRMSNIRPDGTFNIDYAPKYLPNEYYDIYTKYRLIEGDVIIAMTDMAGDPKILGVPTFVRTNGKLVLLNQRVGKLQDIDTSKVHPEFLSHTLNKPSVKGYYKRFAGGGVQLNIGKQQILSLEIGIPPLDVQKTFLSRINQIEKQKQQAEASLVKAEDLFNSLLQRAFKGELTN